MSSAQSVDNSLFLQMHQCLWQKSQTLTIAPSLFLMHCKELLVKMILKLSKLMLQNNLTWHKKNGLRGKKTKGAPSSRLRNSMNKSLTTTATACLASTKRKQMMIFRSPQLSVRLHSKAKWFCTAGASNSDALLSFNCECDFQNILVVLLLTFQWLFPWKLFEMSMFRAESHLNPVLLAFHKTMSWKFHCHCHCCHCEHCWCCCSFQQVLPFLSPFLGHCFCHFCHRCCCSCHCCCCWWSCCSSHWVRSMHTSNMSTFHLSISIFPCFHFSIVPFPNANFHFIHPIHMFTLLNSKMSTFPISISISIFWFPFPISILPISTFLFLNSKVSTFQIPTSLFLLTHSQIPIFPFQVPCSLFPVPFPLPEFPIP